MDHDMSSNPLRNINGTYCVFDREDFNTQRELMKDLATTQKQTADILFNIERNLINVVTGKEYILVETSKQLLKDKEDAWKYMFKVMSWTFGIIIVVVIGLKALAPHIFGVA